jgi:hypothetical protein
MICAQLTGYYGEFAAADAADGLAADTGVELLQLAIHLHVCRQAKP